MNKNSGYGRAMLDSLYSQVPALGRVFVVFDPDDTDEANYQHWQEICSSDDDGVLRFFGTNADDDTTPLEQAYALAESNNNDVIVLDANSTHHLSGMLTVAKNRVHFFGMDGGGRLTTQGAKIDLNDNTLAVAATITVTGTRCSFRNLKVTNSGTDAASVSAFIDAGEGTLIENCNFAKYSDLNVAAVADFICRADGFTYRNVEFGFDTLVQSAARPTFWFKNDGATRAKYGRMVDCIFTCSSSAATKAHIKIENTSSLAFTNALIRPVFLNAIVGSLSAARLNDAITSASGLVEGSLFIVNPASDTTEFCSDTTDNIRVCGAVTATAATGESINAA
jgi:hypothetical protein